MDQLLEASRLLDNYDNPIQCGWNGKKYVYVWIINGNEIFDYRLSVYSLWPDGTTPLFKASDISRAIKWSPNKLSMLISRHPKSSFVACKFSINNKDNKGRKDLRKGGYFLHCQSLIKRGIELVVQKD
jgi:hypothetical protein